LYSSSRVHSSLFSTGAVFPGCCCCCVMCEGGPLLKGQIVCVLSVLVRNAFSPPPKPPACHRRRTLLMIYHLPC
jgi:hypothetical protein